MRKIDKSDWFKEGIGILETKGFAFVTIENLCSILHVTKGSFYHHFKNMDGYIEALMEYWLQENTFAFIERANAESDSFARQQTLYDLSLYASHSSEQSIRATISCVYSSNDSSGWGICHSIYFLVNPLGNFRLSKTEQL